MQETTILIIESSLVIRKSLERGLQRLGYDVVTAVTGEEAHALLNKHHIDLILMNVIMPGEDGFVVLKQFKSDASLAHIPVIFITGLEEVEQRIKALEAGAVDCITKPFHIDEVHARVRIHLNLAKATRAMVKLQAKELKIKEEEEKVSSAQQAVLVNPSEVPKAKFDVFYTPLSAAGGDFYDVIEISEENHGYFVADVAGHDYEASLMTYAVKALIAQNCTMQYHPLASMKIINDVICESFPGGKYLTATYLFVNRRNYEVIIINMGHPPVVYVPKNGNAELVEINGDVLGAFECAVFGRRNFKVQSGDRFVLYTDGVIECLNGGCLWTEGMEVFLEVINRYKAEKAPEFLSAVKEELASQNIAQADDQLLMVLEV